MPESKANTTTSSGDLTTTTATTTTAEKGDVVKPDTITSSSAKSTQSFFLFLLTGLVGVAIGSFGGWFLGLHLDLVVPQKDFSAVQQTLANLKSELQTLEHDHEGGLHRLQTELVHQQKDCQAQQLQLKQKLETQTEKLNAQRQAYSQLQLDQKQQLEQHHQDQEELTRMQSLQDQMAARVFTNHRRIQTSLTEDDQKKKKKKKGNPILGLFRNIGRNKKNDDEERDL
jgi:flagellar biosynthesis GTPase FlhF